MEHIMCSIKNDKYCIYTNLNNIYDKKSIYYVTVM